MTNVKIFLLALADLMDEHSVEWICAKDEYTGYPECGEDIQIRIEHETDYSYDPGLGNMFTAKDLRDLVQGKVKDD